MWCGGLRVHQCHSSGQYFPALCDPVVPGCGNITTCLSTCQWCTPGVSPPRVCCQCSSVMSARVQVFAWIAFISLGRTPKSAIAGSEGNSFPCPAAGEVW